MIRAGVAGDRPRRSCVTLRSRRLGVWAPDAEVTPARASSFAPVVRFCPVRGGGISFATIALDRAFAYEALPRSLVGGPDAATAVLTTVAASMVSLTALVLTITMVVVQLAMGQFSPRIVQRILRDKPSQLAIGLFVATFVQAMLALREVSNNGDGTGRVPGIAVLTGFLLVLASIAVLVIYVQHIGQALRVSALIELVGADTRKLLDRKYPDLGDPLPTSRPGGPAIVRARQSGVVTAVGAEELVEEAVRADCALELVPALGEFVPASAPLFHVHPSTAALDEERLHDAVALKFERTLDEDTAYGIRMLVDIAERSLADSPLQDPTTNGAGDRPAARPPPAARASTVPRRSPPRRHGHAQVDADRHDVGRLSASRDRGDAPRRRRIPEVARRLKSALLDLRSIAPHERVASIDRELDPSRCCNAPRSTTIVTSR